MKECDLTQPILQRYESIGFKCYCEVPMLYRSVDIVAVKDDFIIAIELKRSLTKGVMYQASSNQVFANRSYAAVGTKPALKNMLTCSQVGIGVISVIDGIVTEMLCPISTRHRISTYVERLFEAVSVMQTGGEAGIPCQKGKGPAQDCLARVREYREAHPKASWEAIYRDVPNHYSNAKSMAGAMRVIAEIVDRRMSRIGDATSASQGM